MEEKVEIPISETQKKLLQSIVDDILDMDVTRAISTTVSKNGKNYIYLDPCELEELVGNICFIANHEENNSKLVNGLDKLSDYLDQYLMDDRDIR